MAAPLLCQLGQRHCRLSYLSQAGRCLSSSGLEAPPRPGLAPQRPVHTRFLLYLAQRFHDVEKLLIWTSGLKKWRLKKKNAFYGYTQVNYGDNIATAYYILCLGGGVRYASQPQWFRADHRGRFTWDFMNHKDSPVEEVDASNTVIDYSGLENLVRQQELRSLSLRGCQEVDDWFLSRLHVFQDSLEELDISHCPLITAGGLAALGNLRKLRRLDVSSLPRLQSPGLVVILLEEMLPHCHITAAGYDHQCLALEPLEDQGERLGKSLA